MRIVGLLGLACSVLALAAQPAHADPQLLPGAKALLDAQVQAIASADPKALAATFDDFGFVMFPAAADEGLGRATIDRAAKQWLGATGKLEVKADHPKFGVLAGGMGAWITAELVVTGDHPVRWRVTELVGVRHVDGGDYPSPPARSDYRVIAAHISEPMEDKAALAAVAAQKLPALPAIGSSDHNGTGNDDDFAVAPYSKMVMNDPAATLVGSAAGELVTGKAAVATKLRSWSGLKIKKVAAVSGGDPYSMNAASYVAGHVEITYTVAGKPIVVPYRVLIITDLPMPGSDSKVGFAAAHFSIAQR